MSKVALKRFSHPRPEHDFRVDSLALLIDIAQKQELTGLPAIPRDLMTRRYWQYIDFLQRHGFTCRKIASSPAHIDEAAELRNSDLTDEGFRFIQFSHDKWLDRTYKDGGAEKEERMLESWLHKFTSLRQPNNALQPIARKTRSG